MWWDVIWCDAMSWDVMWCGVMRCDAMRCDWCDSKYYPIRYVCVRGSCLLYSLKSCSPPSLVSFLFFHLRDFFPCLLWLLACFILYPLLSRSSAVTFPSFLWPSPLSLSLPSLPYLFSFTSSVALSFLSSPPHSVSFHFSHFISLISTAIWATRTRSCNK